MHSFRLQYSLHIFWFLFAQTSIGQTVKPPPNVSFLSAVKGFSYSSAKISRWKQVSYSICAREQVTCMSDLIWIENRLEVGQGQKATLCMEDIQAHRAQEWKLSEM